MFEESEFRSEFTGWRYNTRTVMNATFQRISHHETEVVLPLMHEFYAQQHMHFDETATTAALKRLVDNAALGQVYSIFVGPELAGYFVITFCFSLEFHGKFALLDELYIREHFRRRKIGRSVMEFMEGICRERHIKALRLEVWTENSAALSLYRERGFTQEERYLMTKWL